MGIAASLVWQRGLDNRQGRMALTFFAVQLTLNILWSIVFFGFESPLSGVVVIVLLWVAILVTMLKFTEISRGAVVILFPYISWVTFAAILNISIFVLNR